VKPPRPDAPPAKAKRSPIAVVLASCRSAFIGLALISGLINMLMLTGSLFMMQIYDRVIGSQSIPTLVLLSLITVAAYLFQGGLELIRSRVLGLAAERIDEEVGPKVHAAVADLPLRLPRSASEAMQPFRDLELVRSFIGGPGPAAFFDMPWLPIYLIVLFMLHWACGVLTIMGALILIALTWAAEVKGKHPTRETLETQSMRNQTADATQRNAEVVKAMGLLPALTERWQQTHDTYLAAQRRSSFSAGGLAAAARIVRMVLQSAMLGVAAYLAIKGQISSGSIIAASILGGRALAPIDQAIGSWKGFVAARQGYGRLNSMLALYPDNSALFALPPPTRSLTVDNLVVAAPGSRNPIVKRASFGLNAGQALGIIGPSASGKTTLVRAMVGAWQPVGGKVMLDGSSIDQWPSSALGPSIGYLPQDVQLFDGTIAENISRFSKEPPSKAVTGAAEAAGFHEHVVALADGYNTRIGQGGAHLSAGQRQRLGLARALFNEPFLVILDEPNANLDAEGETAVINGYTRPWRYRDSDRAPAKRSGSCRYDPRDEERRSSSIRTAR
jgi:PrtD family type I secretion system ABC transporter